MFHKVKTNAYASLTIKRCAAIFLARQSPDPGPVFANVPADIRLQPAFVEIDMAWPVVEGPGLTEGLLGTETGTVQRTFSLHGLATGNRISSDYFSHSDECLTGWKDQNKEWQMTVAGRWPKTESMKLSLTNCNFDDNQNSLKPVLIIGQKRSVLISYLPFFSFSLPPQKCCQSPFLESQSSPAQGCHC